MRTIEWRRRAALKTSACRLVRKSGIPPGARAVPTGLSLSLSPATQHGALRACAGLFSTGPSGLRLGGAEILPKQGVTHPSPKAGERVGHPPGKIAEIPCLKKTHICCANVGHPAIGHRKAQTRRTRRGARRLDTDDRCERRAALKTMRQRLRGKYRSARCEEKTHICCANVGHRAATSYQLPATGWQISECRSAFRASAGGPRCRSRRRGRWRNPCPR